MSALQTTTPTEQPGAIGGGPFSLDVPDGPGLAEAAEMEVHSSCASADILLDTSREDPKEVVIQNAADWMSLEEESSHPKNNSVDSEPLWSEYQKKEELQKQKVSAHYVLSNTVAGKRTRREGTAIEKGPGRERAIDGA